jgi:hypothetical protein
MGVKLRPERIAEIVWSAAHGTKLHYIPQADLRLMQRAAGLVPELGRAVMHRIASR